MGFSPVEKPQFISAERGEKFSLSLCSFLHGALSYQQKRSICTSAANSWLPHAPLSLKPFPCLSQLSKPSAVCFLLTFSSSDTPGSAADGAWPVGVGRQPALARNFQFQLDLTEGGSHYPYREVGSEKNKPAIS